MYPVAFLLQARNFYEAGFAREISVNQAAARNLLCGETIKFTARFGVAAESALRRICFAGKVLRRPIKFKKRA